METDMTDACEQDNNVKEQFIILFKEAIEKTGMSHAELSSSTRISIEFLQCLEVGDFSSLPGLVFAKGFVKNIAKIAEVEPTKMLELLEESMVAPSSSNMKFAREGINEKEGKVNESVVSEATKALQSFANIDFSGLTRWIQPSKIAYVGLAALAVLVVSAVIRSSGSDDSSTVLSAKTASKAPKAVVEVAASTEELGSEETKVAAQDAAVETKVVKAKDQAAQILEFTVKREVKVKTRIDGKDWIITTLQPDDYRYDFNNKADVLIYDAGAVMAKFNGRSLGELGNTGRVRRLSFIADMGAFSDQESF